VEQNNPAVTYSETGISTPTRHERGTAVLALDPGSAATISFIGTHQLDRLSRSMSGIATSTSTES